MVDGLGRRETNKLVTRQALQEAAERLFAEQGYAATTVRDIAEAAGVTERTFFRYFEGKEELIVDQLLAWLPVLQKRIRSRPAAEPPLVAVKEALLRLDKGALAVNPAPVWIFTDGPPAGRLRRAGPTVLLRTEAAIAEAIRDRLEAAGSGEADDLDYQSEVIARTALALIRSVLIREWQLRSRSRKSRPSFTTLAERAFAAILGEGTAQRGAGPRTSGAGGATD